MKNSQLYAILKKFNNALIEKVEQTLFYDNEIDNILRNDCGLNVKKIKRLLSLIEK